MESVPGLGSGRGGWKRDNHRGCGSHALAAYFILFVKMALTGHMLPPEYLTERQRSHLTEVCQAGTDLHQAYELTQEFVTMIKERKVSCLQDWMQRAEQSGLPALKGFARGLRLDNAAVAAALSSPWSQGQVEGQITRLKLLKRQMYGRAKFDLLRLRVLQAA
jgi:transposase